MTTKREKKAANLEKQLAVCEKSRINGRHIHISKKKAISVYGIGRFPITLYAAQWEALFAISDEILSFLARNRGLYTAPEHVTQLAQHFNRAEFEAERLVNELHAAQSHPIRDGHLPERNRGSTPGDASEWVSPASEPAPRFNFTRFTSHSTETSFPETYTDETGIE